MKLQARFAAYSDIGKIREKNEDNVYISSAHRLAIVADGMGGHIAGEIASSLAIAVFSNVYAALQKKEMTVPDEFLPDLPPVERRMLFSANMSNNAVFEKAQSKAEFHTMGTTLSAVTFEDDEAVAVHIGDTRVYLYRQDDFLQLTMDHSLAFEQVRQGMMTKEEAEKSRVQNVLTRALGIKKNTEFDLLKFKVEPGDVVLLCSDGLNKGLTDAEIKKYLTKTEHVSLAKLCKVMVKKSNENNGRDNISAVLIAVRKPAPKKTLLNGLFKK